MNVYRNETLLDKTLLPAVVLLDGEELADDTDPDTRAALTVRRMTMTPEVQFRLEAKALYVGARLNALRWKANIAILSDAPLLGLTINGRSARYLGSRTVVDRGEILQGAIGCGFSFNYVLDPLQADDPRELILVRLLAVIGSIEE